MTTKLNKAKQAVKQLVIPDLEVTPIKFVNNVLKITVLNAMPIKIHAKDALILLSFL